MSNNERRNRDGASIGQTGKESRDEWFERKVMHYGVEFRGSRYNSDVLVNLRLSGARTFIFSAI